MTRPSPRRRAAASLFAGLAVAILAACSGTGAAPSATGTSPSAPVTTAGSSTGSSSGSSTGSTAGSAGSGAAASPSSTISLPPEQFSGPLEEFYRVPSPLPKGEPGHLIRVMPVKSDATTTTVRVMYHSRDAQDRDRAVTGIITYPTTPAPAEGWPVVSWEHGTVGLTSICAPSRRDGAAPAFGIEGVRVATDYIGLGPLGERHPYLSGLSEGRSAIDAVRAARLLRDAHAGTRWVGIGHSQGGHAALFSHELGEAYAPELDLLGTIVVAPAAVLDKTFGPADQIVPRMVGIMALYGLATDYPEVKPDDYVGDNVKARAGIIDEKCLDGVVLAFVAIPAETFYKVAPNTTEPAASVLKANDPGQVKADAPILLVSGSADTFVVPARVDALNEQLCRIGQVTELVNLEGATHDTEMAQGASRYTKWLQDRFAGTSPANTCPPR